MNSSHGSMVRLREEAEAILKKNPASAPEFTSPDARKLIHELQVYEIELEMQNEELRAANLELVDSSKRFSELYDFAPVGYVTLDRDLCILDANLTAVKMFGLNRSGIKRGRVEFSAIVAREGRDDWFRFRRRMFLGDEKQSYELICRSGDGGSFRCQIESMAIRGVEGPGDRCMVALIDISERKKAQDALLYAGNIIMALATHDGLIMADASGKITDMNPATLAMFGFGSKEDMLRAMSFPGQAMDLTGADGRELPAEQWPLARACGGEKFTGEEFSLYIHPTKRRWYAGISGAPVLDKDGKIEYAVLTIRDISEKKQAEWAEHAARELAERRMNEITEVKNRLDTVMQTIPVGVAVFDARGGRQMSANRAFDDIWGNPRPPAKTIYNYLQDEASWADTGKVMAPEERASLRALENGETVIGQAIRITGFDGVQRVVLNSAAPILDAFGKVAGCVVTIQDITRQMENEKTIRESEERFRNLVQFAPAAIYEMDLQGTKFLSVNDELCKILRYSREELLAMRPADLLDPESCAAFEERISKKMTGEKINESVEYRIRRRDGQWILASLNVGAFYYTEDKPDSVVVVGHDITERKRIEEELSRRMEELRVSNEELARFNRAAVDRELRMVDLKKQVNELCVKAGMEPRYKVEFEGKRIEALVVGEEGERVIRMKGKGH